MGSRRQARVIAFQSLYSWEMNRQDLDEILAFRWMDEDRLAGISEDTLTFSRLLIGSAIEHIQEIDGIIDEHLEHWDFGRLSKVELSILRISTAALLYHTSIPASVTIDEAIDIAKDFASEDSYRFINGVLDGIRKRIESND